jgi:hypothetical protein
MNRKKKKANSDTQALFHILAEPQMAEQQQPKAGGLLR